MTNIFKDIFLLVIYYEVLEGTMDTWAVQTYTVV